MFKPSIQSPTIAGEESFPNVVNAPCSVSYDVQASPNFWMATPTQDIQKLVSIIVGNYQSMLFHFVATARQERETGNMSGQRKSVSEPGIHAELTYNMGLEMLRVTIYPESASSDVKQPKLPDAVIEITVPYTGLPVPGLGASPSGAIVFPNYPFDFLNSPSAPGPTSHKDGKGIYRSSAPILPPDLSLDGGMSLPGGPVWMTYGAGKAPTNYDYSIRDYTPDTSWQSGVTEDGWCKGVGGSAVLTTPLDGKQYWEVEIVTLPQPRKPPNHQMTDIFAGGGQVGPGGWSGGTPVPTTPQSVSGGLGGAGGFYQTTADPGISGTTYDVSWSDNLTAWGTPTIGVVPAYYLPDDLQHNAVTAKPELYQDYSRVVGIDPPVLDPAGPKGMLARSIYGIQKPCKDVATQQCIYTYTFGQYTTSNPAVGVITCDDEYLNPCPLRPAPPGPIPLSMNQWSAVGNAGKLSVLIGVDDGTNYLAGTPITGTAATLTGAADTTSNPVDFPVYTRVGGGLLYGASDGETIVPVWGTWAGEALHAALPEAYTIWKASSTVGSVGPLGVADYVNYILHYTPPALTTSISTINNTEGDFVRYSSFHTFGGGGYQSSYFPNVYKNYADAVMNAFADGPHFGVWLGRLDQWPTFSDAGSDGTEGSGTLLAIGDGCSDGHDVPVDGSLPMAPGQLSTIGQYSGVDLGGLKVGDIVMLATDTKTGCVWFGKNGKWCGPGDGGGLSGPLGPADGPAKGTKWASIMDGGSKSALPVTTPPGPYSYTTGQPRYFPAVGFRIGDFACKVRVGSTVKYVPPSGFKAYGA